MSLLFPEHVRVSLGATYAVLAKVRGRKIIAWRMRQFDAPATGPAWQSALDSVDAWMAELAPGGVAVKVTLSSELAPLHLLPWRDDITRGEQQALLAQSHFRRIYGESAEHWQTTVYPTGHGTGWLASGVDAALLDALAANMRKHGAREHSVMPLAISLFNSLHRRMKAPACWLLVVEPENFVALHLRQGRWQLLLTLPAASLAHEPLHQALLRETRLAGLADSPTELFVLAADTPANLAGGHYVKLDSGWHADAAAMETSGKLPLHLLGAAA